MADSSSKSTSRGARIAAVVVLSLIGLLVFAQGSSGPPEPIDDPSLAASVEAVDPNTVTFPGTAPAADFAALLNGLSLGNEFNGWKVVNFLTTNENVVWIEFGKDRAFFSVWVGAKGKSKQPPPVQTEQYEVGFGMMRPKDANIAPDAMMTVVSEVASRIRARELDVPKPAAL